MTAAPDLPVTGDHLPRESMTEGYSGAGATFPAGDSLLRTGSTVSSGTIMIVDDEPINIKAVKKHLRGAGHENFIATSDSREAMDLIRRFQPDVVLLDIIMPHVSGLHILEAIRHDIQLHHLPVLILTAASDDETKLAALDLGATDILNKPLKFTELIPRVRNALVLKAHFDQQANVSAQLELEVRQRTEELAQSRLQLIHVLACAAEHHDQETGNHVLRVGRYAGITARQLGFSEYRAELIEQAAILHDVGKIGISDAILLKPGKLDANEYQTVKSHCQYGLSILRGKRLQTHRQSASAAGNPRSCESPILKMAATIVISHHEKWDGSGYPYGLAGEAIPLEGRITAVADVFDALSSRRPYKEPLPLDRCFEILEEGRGQHFDPRVLNAFFSRKEEVIEVAQALADE